MLNLTTNPRYSNVRSHLPWGDGRGHLPTGLGSLSVVGPIEFDSTRLGDNWFWVSLTACRMGNTLG